MTTTKMPGSKYSMRMAPRLGWEQSALFGRTVASSKPSPCTTHSESKKDFTRSLHRPSLIVAMKRRSLVLGLYLWATIASRSEPTGSAAANPAAIAIGSRLELFVDDLLIDQLKGTSLKLHEPQPAGVVLKFDAPWERSFSGYVSVLRDQGRFLMYYRGLPVDGGDGSTNEVTCFAESADGLVWTKPKLGLFAVGGSKDNNVVLAGQPPFSHNFSPFLDNRPGVASGERFKALAGTSASGLHVFVSGDGVRWHPWREGPILTQGAFDSQNVAFWSESEHCYAVYFRTWTGGEFAGYRTISRAASADLVHWSAPVEMSFGDTPREHLYTSQTQPYFRAPHIYLATPMRFVPGRRALTDSQAKELGVEPGYASDAADAVLMATRGGNRYARLFMEALIRPGNDPGNWASRAGLTALGIVPTGAAELSLYKQAHYAQASARLVRYTLRTDGFISVNGSYAGGELVSKPLLFGGGRLIINFATSAAGSVRVELQDAAGWPLPGFGLTDAVEQIGDDIERVVTWKNGPDLSRWSGAPVRLRFVIKDADLYSLQFR